MHELVYSGSTKDIYQLSGEEFIFKFSNRYSIFDYGEMPNLIHKKGESTAGLTFELYRYFERRLNIKTHLLRHGESADELVVKRFNVPREFDSTLYYQKRPINAFVPLEVIFRLGVPEGSSLLKDQKYFIGQEFENPLIEFTTKLESIDRKISYDEASKIAGLNEFELDKLVKITSQLAKALKEYVDLKGLKLWDGKFEFAFSLSESNLEREFILVDSISLDEIRLTLDGFPLSKEVLRKIYKNTAWYQELLKAKDTDSKTFREKVSRPLKLNENLINLVSQMYLETQMILSESNCGDLVKLKKIIGEIKNESTYYR